jgi:hypothetical protein
MNFSLEVITLYKAKLIIQFFFKLVHVTLEPACKQSDLAQKWTKHAFKCNFDILANFRLQAKNQIKCDELISSLISTSHSRLDLK